MTNQGQAVSSSGMLTSPKKLTNKEKLERILKELETSKKELLKDINKLNKMKYQVGDFVIHKTKGPCVVMDQYINISKYDLTREQEDYPGLTYPASLAESLPEIGYVVVGPEIHQVVDEKELMPATDATKVLFTK